MGSIIGIILNPKTVLVWIAVIREVIQLVKLIGPEKARDIIKAECSNCMIDVPLDAHAEHEWRHPKL